MFREISARQQERRLQIHLVQIRNIPEIMKYITIQTEASGGLADIRSHPERSVISQLRMERAFLIPSQVIRLRIAERTSLFIRQRLQKICLISKTR